MSTVSDCLSGKSDTRRRVSSPTPDSVYDTVGPGIPIPGRGTHVRRPLLTGKKYVSTSWSLRTRVGPTRDPTSSLVPNVRGRGPIPLLS